MKTVTFTKNEKRLMKKNKISSFKTSNYHLRTFSLFTLITVLMFFSCEKSPDQEKLINDNLNTTNYFKTAGLCEVSLLAAQNIEIGTVTSEFSESGNELTITYTITNNDWCMMETHLDVQADPANFPQTKKGNPKIGQFAYGQSLNCESSWIKVVDLSTIEGWNEGDEIFIAAHAEVKDLSNQEESAWSCCEPFPGSNWAMYFQCIQPQWVCGEPIIDVRDGQSYNTVQIGNQCWMAENLNIGTMINGNTDQSNNNTLEKHCFDNSTSNCDTYGAFYQWSEMMQYVTTEGAQGICLDGWHIPSDDEWKILEGNVDTQFGVGNSIWNQFGWRGNDVGGNIKETGTEYWHSPNFGATNSSGFTALGGGYKYNNGGIFIGFDYETMFWTSTEYSKYTWAAIERNAISERMDVWRDYREKTHGYSVRCVKD